MPPIHRKNLYSLQYSMLPVQRVGIGELWRLLTGNNAGAENGKVNGVHVNGVPHAPTPGTGKKGPGKKREAYWWSR